MTKTGSRDGVNGLPTAAVMDPPATLKSRTNPTLPALDGQSTESSPKRKQRTPSQATNPKHFTATHPSEDGGNRQAELFYLQKQIQLQTPMVFILEDGAKIQGIVEWYDRHSVKVRGKSRLLIYKSAIKYLYKAGEFGAAPDR